MRVKYRGVWGFEQETPPSQKKLPKWLRHNSKAFDSLQRLLRDSRTTYSTKDRLKDSINDFDSDIHVIAGPFPARKSAV